MGPIEAISTIWGVKIKRALSISAAGITTATQPASVPKAQCAIASR
jgi:hypothetical protein